MRRVAEVMGPMEARRMWGGRVRLAASSKEKRFETVEELVNVMAFGNESVEEKRDLMESMLDVGRMVW